MRRPSAARRAARSGAALATLGCGAGLVLAGLDLTRPAPPLDAAAVARGGAAYAAHCTGCHGVPGGPAPPLDATGHAWRHPDAQLAGIIAAGNAVPGPAAATMPGFAGQLGPDGIADLLAYLKSTWPAACCGAGRRRPARGTTGRCCGRWRRTRPRPCPAPACRRRPDLGPLPSRRAGPAAPAGQAAPRRGEWGEDHPAVAVAARVAPGRTTAPRALPAMTAAEVERVQAWS